MALSANRGSDFDAKFGRIRVYPVLAAVHIYRFGLVTLVGGYARPAYDDADDSDSQVLLGFAMEEADNTASGAQNGDINVRVREEGAINLSIASAAQTDVGKVATVSDDTTARFYNAASTGNLIIGRIIEIISSIMVRVSLEDRPGRIASSDYDADVDT